MISVVLATYNSKKFIKKQLDSIKNQTVPVDEVIVMDDCSSDDTVEFTKQYIKENVLDSWKIYEHECNKGYIKTFKDALALAKGEIIITCDHDDLWLPNKVELIRDVFEKNSEVLYLATSFIQIDEHDNEVPIKQKRSRSNNNLIRRTVEKGALNQMNLRDVSIYNIAPGCTCALSKKLKDIYISFKDMKIPHDWTLAMTAACMDGLYYLDVATTKYRIYSQNTIGLGHEGSYSKRVKVVENNLCEKQEMLKLVKEMDADKKDIDYLIQINRVFYKRVEYLRKKNIVKLLFLSVRSIAFGKLYESIIYDCISVINGDKAI